MYHHFYLWLVSSILDSTKWRICPKLPLLRYSPDPPRILSDLAMSVDFHDGLYVIQNVRFICTNFPDNV